MVSEVPSERSVFSLNTAIMAVAKGNFGRMGTRQQQRYTTGNARIQLDPKVWEMPGAMPEIAPEGDFTPNIDRLFTERSMVLQAWGAYGNLWPVVAQQLGVSPDLGRDRVRVVAQVPRGQSKVSGRHILLGDDGEVSVTARRSHGCCAPRSGSRAGDQPHHRPRAAAGARGESVRLDGKRVDWASSARPEDASWSRHHARREARPGHPALVTPDELLRIYDEEVRGGFARRLPQGWSGDADGPLMRCRTLREGFAMLTEPADDLSDADLRALGGPDRGVLPETRAPGSSGRRSTTIGPTCCRCS